MRRVQDFRMVSLVARMRAMNAMLLLIYGGAEAMSELWSHAEQAAFIIRKNSHAVMAHKCINHVFYLLIRVLRLVSPQDGSRHKTQTHGCVFCRGPPELAIGR